MQTTDQDTQDYVARYYEKRHTGTGFLWHARIVTDMLRGVGFRDGRHSDSILDAGCGTGFISQLYPNFDITGIDISDGMLQRNPYKWEKASVYETGFETNSFDWVIARGLLHHLEDPRKAMKELTRVLKPGGKFVCYETNQSALTTIPRYIATFTKRFSRDHKNFRHTELEDVVRSGEKLQIYSKKFYGYISLPLIGFPDILDLRIPLGIARGIMAFDEFISKTPLAPLGFNTMIKAVKTL